VPYRVDLHGGDDSELCRLIELGALDVERSATGLAAVMPDRVTPHELEHVLGRADVSVSPAVGRDADSVWVLAPRPVQLRRLLIVPAGMREEADALKLIDAPAFGTGLHPTTALCLEALEDAVENVPPGRLLDVGTGSGVLALAALRLGVPRAVGLDVDERALHAAAQNARLNGAGERLRLVRGGPEAISGTWPLVLANVLAAPLIAMAPALARLVGHHGRIILSGIPSSVEPDVDRAYRHLGMRRVEVKSRAGWVALVLQASW
jgi:ribosomal protein L11 methyltransferase